MVGIPTVCLTREGFEGIVANAFSGMGFPAEAPMGYVFPSLMFITESDLTPLSEHMDEFLSGLTDWEPERKTTGLLEPELITIKGRDYYEAMVKVNNYFARNLWRDSLWIVPPTEDVVNWILTGTDKDPKEQLGTAWPRGGIVTVHSVAVALAMAGGRPEYLPWAIAATKAMVDPRAGMQSWNSTTCSVFPAFIVNGPDAKDIRLGSGYGMLGPDPTHPAGQILGRTIRIIQMNIGGAIPGVGTMSIYGASRQTNAFFAEYEEGLPEGWTTYAEDRGWKKDQNVVTITFVNSMVNVLWGFGGETANNQAIRCMAGNMKAPNWNRLAGMITGDGDFSVPDLPSGVSLWPHTVLQALVRDNGYTKSQLKELLYENAREPYEDIVAWGGEMMLKEAKIWHPGDNCGLCTRPDQLTVVCGGGDQGGHGFWMAPAIFGLVTSCEVELPKNWDDLMLEAEIDLGAPPSAH